jgi:HK97 gp10 family phage protein
VTTINIKGLSELQTFLSQLPAKIEANVIRGALRAGAKPIRDAAKSAAPTGEPSETNKQRYRLYQGALRDSIRISGRIDRRDGKITASIKAGGKNRNGADVFYANFIEYGTKPHGNHPGIQPRPFLRPAMDAQAGAAVVAVGEYIKKRLATKHGLDTADIVIEVDE